MPVLDVSPLSTYTWQECDDATRDLKIFEISRNDGSPPYTVLLHCFSRSGYLALFQQLYSTSTWAFGETLSSLDEDTVFCKKLWTELGLDGEFNPYLLEFDITVASAVYRLPKDQVLARKYGSGMVETWVAR